MRKLLSVVFARGLLHELVALRITGASCERLSVMGALVDLPEVERANVEIGALPCVQNEVDAIESAYALP